MLILLKLSEVPSKSDLDKLVKEEGLSKREARPANERPKTRPI